MEIWIWVIAGIVLGAAAGAAFTYWWTRARGGGDTIGQLKRENQKFREEVTEHFVETARLINQLTDSYKEVFDHLNKGASELVDEKALAERLPASGSEEVRLRRLGAPAPASDAASDSNGDASGGTGSSTPSSRASAATSTASKGAADGGARRAPHERADIEAGPRREAEKRSDRDVDPLKRQSGGADARERSEDRSDDEPAPDRAGNGEKGEKREKSAEDGDRSSNNDGDSASTPSSTKSGSAASSGSAGASPSAGDDHQRKSGGT
jgi:hypothetical protein